MLIFLGFHPQQAELSKYHFPKGLGFFASLSPPWMPLQLSPLLSLLHSEGELGSLETPSAPPSTPENPPPYPTNTNSPLDPPLSEEAPPVPEKISPANTIQSGASYQTPYDKIGPLREVLNSGERKIRVHVSFSMPDLALCK